MADGSDTQTGSAKTSGGSTLVPILLFANLGLVAAVLVLFLLRGGGVAKQDAAPAAAKPGAPPAAAQAAPPGPSAKLSDFVVHLRDVETDRYARLSFEIEVAAEEDRVRLTAFMPRIRDAFIAFLSDRTLAELRGSEAIAHTKATLEEKLKQLAPGVAVRGLFVTDLVIQ
jgi:flagellar FliL protein